jgi:hypothetical protein
MGTIPLSGAPDPDEQSLSIGLPSRHVSRAMIAKVGVAARHSHSARPATAATRPIMSSGEMDPFSM